VDAPIDRYVYIRMLPKTVKGRARLLYEAILLQKQLMLEKGYRGGEPTATVVAAEQQNLRVIFRWMVVLLSLLAAIGCLGFGTVILTRALENTRDTKVSLYNNAVQKWSISTQLAPLEVFLSLGNSTFKLNPSTSPDELHDPITEDLQNYNPLKLTYAGPLFPQVKWDQEQGQLLQTLKIHILAANNETESEIEVKDLIFYDTVWFERTNPKTCLYQRKGYWNSRLARCEKYQQTKKICFAILFDAQSQRWKLAQNDHNGRIGCFGTGENRRAEDFVWIPGVSQGFGSGGPPAGILDFSGLTTMIRYSDDPFLVASKLSEGTLTFGPTKTDDLVRAATFFGLSVVLSLPSIGLCILSCQEREEEYERGSGKVFGDADMQNNTFNAWLGRFWIRLQQIISASPKVSDDFDGL